MELQLRIDTRETELYKKCEQQISNTSVFKDIKLHSETLPLGDIIISNGNHDLLVIERKTIADLSSSIKDGRYDEQSYRLNGLPHHNHNIIYLIEGDINKTNTFKGYNQFRPSGNTGDNKMTLYSAMFSILFYKGFSLMRSQTIDETALMICNMVYKISKDVNRTGFYTNDVLRNNTDNTDNTNNTDNNTSTNENTELDTNTTDTNSIPFVSSEKDYCSVIKKVKKDNITKDNIGEIMLCNIPGVSSTISIAILAQYKTLPNLIAHIQEDESCLNNIMTTDSNGKSRKISKTAISTIIQYLRD